MSRKRVVQIWLDNMNVQGYPDISSWPVAQLMEEYGLNGHEAGELHLAVNIDPNVRRVYSLPDELGLEFLNLVQESIHQGHDGYTDADRFVIDMFLNDLAIGIESTIRDNYRHKLITKVKVVNDPGLEEEQPI